MKNKRLRQRQKATFDKKMGKKKTKTKKSRSVWQKLVIVGGRRHCVDPQKEADTQGKTIIHIVYDMYAIFKTAKKKKKRSHV